VAPRRGRFSAAGLQRCSQGLRSSSRTKPALSNPAEVFCPHSEHRSSTAQFLGLHNFQPLHFPAPNTSAVQRRSPRRQISEAPRTHLTTSACVPYHAPTYLAPVLSSASVPFPLAGAHSGGEDPTENVTFWGHFGSDTSCLCSPGRERGRAALLRAERQRFAARGDARLGRTASVEASPEGALPRRSPEGSSEVG